MSKQFINIDFAGSKNVFMAKLRELIQTPTFCGEKNIDFRRIDKLTGELEDNISIDKASYIDSNNDIKEEIKDLEDAISTEGESIEFTPDKTVKSGRRYLIACSKNDQEERIRRAEIMRDASRTVIF